MLCRPSCRSRFVISLLCALGLMLSRAEWAIAQDQWTGRPYSNTLLQACRQIPACSEHLDRADRAYDQSQSSEALKEYQAAYAISPYPLILYNIARLHHKEHRLTEAIDAYQRYLDTGDTERQERVRLLLREAQGELHFQPTVPNGSLGVSILAPGVAVAAPGRPLPARPLYKRGWVWAVVGSVVAAGVVGGVVAATWPRPWQPDAGIDSVAIFLKIGGVK